jgi:hypothetical protein
VQIHLGNRNVEFAMQARHQRLDAPALVLERERVREVEVNGEDGEHSFQFNLTDSKS